MLWIKCLIFIGIIDVLYADDDDIYCFLKKLGVCSIGKTDLCSKTQGLRACISDSAVSCSMINDRDVKSVLNFLTDETCEEGTPTNKIYTAKWSCISKTSGSSGCNNDLIKEIVELRKQISNNTFLRESHKLGCEFNHMVSTCTLSKIKDSCGLDAESFYREQQNSGINQLNKRVCDYLNGIKQITYYGNGVSPISTYLSIWMLQTLILFFIFKWSSY